MLLVNQAYFKYEKPKCGTKKNTQTESTWFDSFQYLISAGHRPDDTMNMTYGAFDQYLKSAQKIIRINCNIYRVRSGQFNQGPVHGLRALSRL